MYKNLDLWLPSYLRRPSPPVAHGGVTDILLAVCDHFEPLHLTDYDGGIERLKRWIAEHPKLIEPYRDADKIRPRHTFFYPVEQYDAEIGKLLAELCALCGGEVELHLHHEYDTAAGVREKLERGKADLARHNFLSRDASSKIRYGFVHGNWALDDSHPGGGKDCGVPNELGILMDTGCYADFTMPSAPHPTQTRIINSIYYAQDTPAPKSHDTGVLARVRASGDPVLSASPGHLLMVQGPLALNWKWRKMLVFPRIENGVITGVNPPRPDRMAIWIKLAIHVQARPEWLFIKLYTHGAMPRNMVTLLGDPMRRFHEHLLSHFNDGRQYRLHYVSAREMVNIIHAAEDGKTGNPGLFRDYRYTVLPPRP